MNAVHALICSSLAANENSLLLWKMLILRIGLPVKTQLKTTETKLVLGNRVRTAQKAAKLTLLRLLSDSVA